MSDRKWRAWLAFPFLSTHRECLERGDKLQKEDRGMLTLTTEEYHENCEEYNGYCTNCKDITRFGMTEPDAREYECPTCHQKTCMGIEWAMVGGEIEVEDE